MQAFQLVGWRQPPELREVPVPEPGPGQVLVKVGGAGACHSDLHLMEAPGPPPGFATELPGSPAIGRASRPPNGRRAGAPSAGWPRLSGELFTAVIPADGSRTGQSAGFHRTDQHHTPLSDHTARWPASHTTERVRRLPRHRPGELGTLRRRRVVRGGELGVQPLHRPTPQKVFIRHSANSGYGTDPAFTRHTIGLPADLG